MLILKYLFSCVPNHFTKEFLVKRSQQEIIIIISKWIIIILLSYT